MKRLTYDILLVVVFERSAGSVSRLGPHWLLLNEPLRSC